MFDADLESFSRLNYYTNCLMDLGQTAYIRRTPGFYEANPLYAKVKDSNLLEPTYVLVQFAIDAGIRSLPKEWRWLGYMVFAWDRYSYTLRNQRLTGKGYPSVSFSIKF